MFWSGLVMCARQSPVSKWNIPYRMCGRENYTHGACAYCLREGRISVPYLEICNGVDLTIFRGQALKLWLQSSGDEPSDFCISRRYPSFNHTVARLRKGLPWSRTKIPFLVQLSEGRLRWALGRGTPGPAPPFGDTEAGPCIWQD